MAKSSPVSDTQTLLQSMLQRLKLQIPAERTHTQEQAPSPALKLDDGSGESPSVYQFGDSIDPKQQGSSPSIWRHLDSPWSFHSSHEPLSKPSAEDHNSGTSATTPNDYVMPRWERRQLKFYPRKVSDDNCSISSSNTTEYTLTSTSPSVPLPTPPVPGRRTSGERSSLSSVWTEGVGDTRRDDMNVEDKMTPMRASRTSKRKWGNLGQKRWTQKVKERWNERRKKERGTKQKEEPNEVPKSNHCPTPTNPYPSDENTTTTALAEVETIDQQQPINSGPDQAPPSPLDHMSDTLFSFGSFNLMEEIFTGEEWAKFFQSSTSSQPEFTCINQDQAIDSRSSVSQSHRGEQTTGNLRDYKWTTASDLRMTPSQINSESFQQEMDISDHTFSQTKASDFSLPFSQTFELFKDQSEPFGLGLDQPQSMDLSLDQSENDKQPKYQPQLLDIYQNCQPKATEGSVQQLPSSEQNLRQSQLPDPNRTQPESVHEDVIPLLDLSYLQDNGTHGSLSRKRGHCTLSRSPSDRGKSEDGEIDKGTDNAVMPLYPLHPAPSLSPASSVSSLQYSISQDSESSASTETVVKKRRLENTRRVHFAEEVIFIPPLILYEDEDEGDNDNDDYDDDNDGDGNDDDDDTDEDDDEGEDNCHEESQSRPSVPNWIVALKTKTKRKAKFKLPQMASTPTKFKSSKFSFI